MILPRINLDISKQNFVFNGSFVWNNLISKLFDKCSPNEKGIMVPGSAECSDLSAPISSIKNKLKVILFETQKLVTPGRNMEWMSDNKLQP